ncbi:MAG: hypothetical protein PHO63_06460 [Bacilli bacterium]|nr:hypothetical protein [Bacilli bacterium]MDD4809522.1 hypothetical protein [Bacilli bacterium]
MKLIKKIILILFVFVALPFMVDAKENVNIYLFHASWCPHCKDEIEFLNKIEDEYDNIKIFKYEVGGNTENAKLMSKVKKGLGLPADGSIPFTVIGEKVISGYGNENSTGELIRLMINYYSDNPHRDVANEIIIKGKLINQIKDPEDLKIIYDYGKNKNNENEKSETRNIPLLGDIDAKKVSLPLLSVVLGSIDGFNPCAMWILLFLISMLIGTNNRKRMWTIGLTFIGTSALVYMLFMVAWLKIVLTITETRAVMILISLVALIGGAFNLYNYFKARKKDNGCHVVKNEKRNKIINRIRTFTSEKSLILAIIGTIALAFSVNLVELACSANIPVVFTQILAINGLSTFETAIYILIYIFFFLLDDLIVFAIAMKTLTVTGITTKYSKYSHLIGGILMIIIGLLLIFKPELLMFAF